MATTRHTPTCPNGHGQLEDVPHLWALEGWNEEQVQDVLKRPNGKRFLVRIHVCKTCGNVQLYDPEERR